MILLNYKPVTSQLRHDSKAVKNQHHYNHQWQIFDQSTIQIPIKCIHTLKISVNGEYNKPNHRGTLEGYTCIDKDRKGRQGNR